jgi:uncharacterized protein with GYD domain
MATYVTLYRWTEQGIKNFRDTPDRAKAAIAQAEKMGGKITQLLWTSGEYDLVGIAEFPDDQSVSAFNLALASNGNIRSTTMRAYNEREMTAIIAKTR